jgi:hypothetical protein
MSEGALSVHVEAKSRFLEPTSSQWRKVDGLPFYYESSVTIVLQHDHFRLAVFRNASRAILETQIVTMTVAARPTLMNVQYCHPYFTI